MLGKWRVATVRAGRMKIASSARDADAQPLLLR
jgi:hypothetical protein